MKYVTLNIKVNLIFTNFQKTKEIRIANNNNYNIT